MERITFKGNFCDISMCRENPCPYNGMCSQRQTWERLKEYEDTGLEPQDIISAVDMSKIACALHELNAYKDLGPIDHIRDLIKAEQDGRLVVLPCKVGDTIYYTMAGWPVVEHIKVRTFFVGDPTRRGEILHLHMIRTDKFDVSMDALGKTVFLTREEAEAALALKGGEG